jgi:hypothetical protein
MTSVRLEEPMPLLLPAMHLTALWWWHAMQGAMAQLGVERSLHEAITFSRACGGSSRGLSAEQLLAALSA